MTPAETTLLLPARERFGGQRLSEPTGRWLGRADSSDGNGEQMARMFDIQPRGWPVAAVSRQRDAGDAGSSCWVRADPVFIRPDINGARLLAHGDALALSAAESEAFLQALKPLFGDAGLPIDAPVPTRWYLRLAGGSPLPPMVPIEEALGADVFEHLPGGGEGRRWRALLSEAQVTLHNHPRNAERVRAGLAPVNSVWFWGGGRLPDRVRSAYTLVYSDDDALLAFGALAGAATSPLPTRWPAGEVGGARLFDLRDARDLALLERDWFAPLLGELAAGRVQRLTFDFADGHRRTLHRGQRLRFWRRPLRSLLVARTQDTA